MGRLPLSFAGMVALGLVIHLDWHLGRPHHMRMSMGWGGHWLLALPVFALLAGYLAGRFPDRLWAASAITLLGAVVGTQILEPLAENLTDSRFTLDMPAERWVVFAQFMAAGLMTYVVAVALIERRRTST